MGGFFGAVSRKNCKYDVFFGTDYHSHLGTKRGGLAFYDPQKGFDRQILDKTDVLVYWGHKYWREVDDDHVDYLHKRVLEGMGLIVRTAACGVDEQEFRQVL